MPWLCSVRKSLGHDRHAEPRRQRTRPLFRQVRPFTISLLIKRTLALPAQGLVASRLSPEEYSRARRRRHWVTAAPGRPEEFFSLQLGHCWRLDSEWVRAHPCLRRARELTEKGLHFPPQGSRHVELAKGYPLN